MAKAVITKQWANVAPGEVQRFEIAFLANEDETPFTLRLGFPGSLYPGRRDRMKWTIFDNLELVPAEHYSSEGGDEGETPVWIDDL